MFYNLQNEFISVKINDIGAELSSYFDKEASREIIWQGDPNHWKRQAPVLFPIIGKVENNSYLFEKKTYFSYVVNICQYLFNIGQYWYCVCTY